MSYIEKNQAFLCNSIQSASIRNNYVSIEGAPPRYEEVVPDYRATGRAVPTATTTSYRPAPSAPTQSLIQAQGQGPSILRSSSPPSYWAQRQRGSMNRTNPAPTAPAWGDHLPSLREEQPPLQPFSSPGRPLRHTVHVAVLDHTLDTLLD